MNDELINSRRLRAVLRPDAQAVRAKLAGEFQISATQIFHHQMEAGIADPHLETQAGESRLVEYVRACIDGVPVAQVKSVRAEFIWRFRKHSLRLRGFALNARLRRAAEVIALASAAHVERVGHRFVITLEACSVVLEPHPEGALVVTAYAHAPFTPWHFLEVADRVRDRVTLMSRIGGSK